jgi:stage II sporulation protein R
LTAIGGQSVQTSKTDADYLRIHIRANSNGAEDQSVKYLVRDDVVAYLTPLVASCATKAEAMEAVGNCLTEISSIARNTLEKNGFSYGAAAGIRREAFPSRIYGEYTLKAGEYDALILELGSGEGDNWWCCIYPPFCFTAGNGNVVYRSAIAEIIRKWKGA